MKVVLYTDGKADAAPNPIHGANPAARFLLSATRESLRRLTLVTRVEQINGQPSVVYYPPDGKEGCVVTLDIADECIRNIYIVTNP